MNLFRTIHASAHATGLPDASVQCIVTSPPYWGLRKYSGEQDVEWPAVDYAPMPGLPPLHVDAMRCALGLEPTPEAYIGHMVLVMREMRRVLRDDGVAFVNLGDSYNGSGGAGGDYNEGGLKAGQPKYGGRNVGNLKPKDMVGIPWRLAFAAQADGWWLRSDIVWAKPNPMPESVTDRPTKAHEYVFLLAKSARYYWDADAVREPLQESTVNRYQYGWNGVADDGSGGSRTGSSFQKMKNGATMGEAMGTNGRNMRDVWTIATSPFPGAHFATFPPALVEPCILAGTSARGACPTCGAPWQRVVERTAMVIDRSNNHPPELRTRTSGTMVQPPTSETTGWQPTCACFGEFADSAIPQPCVVLDPFHGSGTTGVVALRLGRAYIGVDISEEYLHGVTQQRMGAGVQVGMGI